jgi:type II secretory pathway component GspD/PulD (secretin)
LKQADEKKPEPKKKEEKAEEKSPEKRVAFNMSEKPWGSVLSWLADQTGKSIITQIKPTGSFTFISPKGKLYTIPEVIDIINEALLSGSATQKYYLINGERTFTMVPADEKIDPALVPRITVEQMKEHGKTELVSIILKLRTQVPADIAPEVKKMMGPFGEVVAMEKAQQLILTDTVSNLRRIVKTLTDIDKDESGKGSLTYKCKWIKASEAERILKELLGDTQKMLDQAVRSARQPFERGQPAQPIQLPKIRMHFITSNERANTVLVSGPADKVSEAESILKRIDIETQKGQKPILTGPPVLKIYSVQTGTADALAKTLQEVYKASATCRITTAGTNKVLAYATPEDQIEIARHITDGTEKSSTKVATLSVGDLDAGTVAKTLQGMFGETKTGAPYIEAVTERNAVVVRGSEDQIDEVKGAIKAMGGDGGLTAGARLRTIDLGEGSATMMAEELGRIMQQMRKNPVQVIAPGGDGEKAAPAPKLPMRRGTERESRLAPRNDGLTPIAFKKDGPGGLVDPRDAKKDAKDSRPGNADKPIRIFASGNRLLIASDDPEALALMQQIINLYTKYPGKGGFTVIRLKNATATEASKALDEAFNGPKQTNAPGQQQFGGFFGRFGGAAAQPPVNPEANRIRVVAYPATNSLLVRATPLDMLAIKSLLAKALDTDENDSKGLIRTSIVPLKYANATEVANVIKDVYREQTNQNPLPTQAAGGRGGRGAFFAGLAGNNRNVDANGNPRQVMLSLGVDDRTNSLVIACPDALATDIKRLCGELDKAAQLATPSVRVVSIKGIDPLLMQQALDAITGQTVRRAPTMDTQRGSLTGALPGAGALPFTGGLNVPRGGGLPSSFGPGGTLPGAGGGGGFQPGMGGGGRGGGGGGPPGGGGGGRGGRGGRGGMGDSRQPGRGPDFFEQRVMDDPQPSQFFDPQLDKTPTAVVQAKATTPGAPGTPAGASGAAPPKSPPLTNTPPTNTSPTSTPTNALPAETLHFVKFAAPPVPGPTMPATPVPPPTPAIGGASVIAPRGPVNIEALPQLGAVVIRANSQADMDAVLRIIAYLQKDLQGGDLQIEVIVMKEGDATSITNILTEFYRRVVVGPSGNQRSLVPASQTQTTPQGLVITQQQLSSVVLLPLGRFNAILVAAPKARFKEVRDQILQLDTKNKPDVGAKTIQLSKVPASRIGRQLATFYATRYPNDVNLVRVSWDDASNTLIVQASPADMADIEDLVRRIDTQVPKSNLEVRLVPLRNGVADDVANLILRAVTQGVQITQTTGTGIVPTTGFAGGPGGAAGGFPGGAAGGFPGGQAGGGFPGAAGNLGGAGGIPGLTGAGAGGILPNTKFNSLRFISTIRRQAVEAGYLEDIRLVSDPRINAILVEAPPQSMDMILALIAELDVPPAARAEINIFPLKKADANYMAATIQQLFLGSSSLQTTGGAGATGGLPGAAGGLPGAAGGLPGATAGAFPGTTGALGVTTARPLVLTLGGVTPEGAPLIDLRLTVDLRTNSLIVAGSRNDLEVIEALVTRLEDADVQQRQNDVYRLVNSNAVDVATALNNFITSYLSVFQRASQLTPFQDYQREIIVVPEPITNKLLISATPRYYPDIMRLIHELDAELPQVVIQVLIAEVDLNSTEEVGAEIGLQSPVLFQRSLFPAYNNFNGGAGTTSYVANTATPTFNTVGLYPSVNTVPTGVTVSGVGNASSILGFNFNQPGLGLGNNPIVSPAVVGYQGLTSLGVGRTSPNIPGVSGFVFSASSDTFNLLVRALKAQGRIDVLSRPQIMTLDNQAASIQIGSSVPYQASAGVAAGTLTTAVSYITVGVLLNVIPKIAPDGKVTLRVTPTVSKLDASITTPGVAAPAYDTQTIDTTVTARDGETVVIAGLIKRSDQKTENKVPWLGDLPVFGALFRYREQIKSKQELIIVMTPHIVRNRKEADQVLAMEGARMDWVLSDIVKTHGISGMAPLFPPAPAPGHPAVDGAVAPGGAGPRLMPLLTPAPGLTPGNVLPAPRVVPGPAGPGALPPPRPVPMPGPAPAPAPAPTPGAVPAGGSDRPLAGLSALAAPPVGDAGAAAPVVPAAAAPADGATNPGKESDRWRLTGAPH